MKYEVVIGLEIHAQLSTNSKIFCGCTTKFGGEHNSQVCPVCIGMPGTLPVVNRKVAESAIKMGLSINSQVINTSIFARKNYFYPDLPKGYQISQYDRPICEDGCIDILTEGGVKTIGITRVHIEEDPAKLIHDSHCTKIDFNRSGTPLIEIVSEPDIRSSKEAFLYLTKLRQILQYLDICDGNMEEGSLRCDANVSLRPFGQKEFGTKTEMKNMNSFHGVERAIEYEISRQTDVLDSGGVITQDTLLWDDDKSVAITMRTKEDAHDYRYFPEPDIPPLTISNEEIEIIRKEMPELPDSKRARFISEYAIPEYDAEILASTRHLADYFEDVVKTSDDPKKSSNWIMSELIRIMKDDKVDNPYDLKIEAAALGKLIALINKGTISGKIAKTVFSYLKEDGGDPETIVKEKGLVQITDNSAIEKFVDDVILANPDQVKQFKEGKEKVIGFLVGQVMKQSGGKANPGAVNSMLKEKMSL